MDEFKYSEKNYYEVCSKITIIRLVVKIVLKKEKKMLLLKFSNYTKDKLALIFFVVSLIFGVYWSIQTPPLQVPDEDTHFYSTVTYAMLELEPQYCDGNFEKRVATGVVNMENIFVPVANGMPFHDDINMTNIKYSKSSFSDGGESSIGFRTLTTAPLCYLPSILGVMVGKFFSHNAWTWLIFGRIFGVIFYSIVVYVALRMTPVLKNSMFLIGLMPMSIFQVASVSYDVTTIAISIFSFALISKLLCQKEKIKNYEIVMLSLCFILLVFCKEIYAPMFLLLFFVSTQVVGKLKNKIVFWISVFIPGVALHWLWGKIVQLMFTVPENLVKLSAANVTNSPAQQQDSVTHHFGQFIYIVFHTLERYTMHDYLIQFVGMFGWLDTPICITEARVFLIVLLLTVITDCNGGMKWIHKIVFLITGGLGILAIFWAAILWGQWSGENIIGGVQGRYFIPLFLYSAIILNVFPIKNPKIQKGIKILVVLVALLMLVYSSVVIYQRYYLPV